MAGFCARGAFILLSLLLSFVSISPCVEAQTRGLEVVARPINQEALPIGKQIAVLIAIDRYSGWLPLKKPVSDARALKEILERRYYIDVVHELYNEAATRVGIIRFMESLIKDTRPEDSVFIYYAGHGHLDPLMGIGAWIPQDAGTDPYEQRNWLPNEQIRALIGMLKSRHVVLASDSCFSGKILNLGRGSIPAITNDYFRTAFARRSRQVLASGVDSVPDESPFSAALLRTLNENTAPYLDPYMLFNEIRLSVKDTTPVFGDLKDSEVQDGGSFIFFLKDTTHIPPVPDPIIPRLAPTTGRLTVYAQPSDTRVYVDSPVLMELISGWSVDLVPGTYAFRLEREGYREQTRRITLEAGREERIEVTLNPGRPGRLDLPTSVIPLKLLRGGTEIDPLDVPSGIELDLELTSPQALALDLRHLRLRLAEGENRTVDVPSGRFVLPDLPEGCQVAVGGLVVNNTAGSTGPGRFISPELPAGIYEITIKGPFSWTGKVATKPTMTVEPGGYRETAIRSFIADKASLESRMTVIPRRRTAGWVSFVGGIAGAAGAAASYFLGQEAMEAYQSAIAIEDIDAAKAQVLLYGTLFPAAAALGGIGFLLAPVFWSGDTEAALKESIRRLDESIQRLSSF